MQNKRIFAPQPGFQTNFLASTADIVVGGSAAGVGKTWALLVDPLRVLDTVTYKHVNLKLFGGVIFRRTTPQIRNTGGLWDASYEIYLNIKGEPKESSLDWDFKGGASVSFRHLEYEKNIYDWQGTEIAYLGFDELTHFTEKMFFYLLTRNRSTCGIKPYCRATCNPDPDSWVYKLIQWWIDPLTGYPIKEREGVIRYFVRYKEDYIWGDTHEEVATAAAFYLDEIVENSQGIITHKDLIKSITFISGSIYDNKELLKRDPGYIGNLLAQDEDTKLQLFDSCWKAGTSPDDVYDYQSFNGMFNNVMDVQRKGRYITADIAMKGSDKFVVGYWEGFELMDVEVMSKSDGKEVVDMISAVAKYYGVQNQNIVYDADGVGSFIDGFIVGSKPFNNNGIVIDIRDPVSKKIIKENYQNLKTQCYYRSGDRVNKGGYRINSNAAGKMYDASTTLRQRFVYERKAIKKHKADFDGKLRILPKEEMKIKLNGQSPDLMDMFMMREYFELQPTRINTDADY